MMGKSGFTLVSEQLPLLVRLHDVGVIDCMEEQSQRRHRNESTRKMINTKCSARAREQLEPVTQN